MVDREKTNRKIPWRKPWQPTPIVSPGESHGQRSLAGYSPWGHKELDMTEQHTDAVEKVRNSHLIFAWCSTIASIGFKMLQRRKWEIRDRKRLSKCWWLCSLYDFFYFRMCLKFFTMKMKTNHGHDTLTTDGTKSERTSGLEEGWRLHLLTRESNALLFSVLKSGESVLSVTLYGHLGWIS